MVPVNQVAESGLLTIRQAAELLGVHPLTLRNWSEKRAVPCLRTPGGHRRYRLQDLQRMLAAPQEDPATAAAIVQLVRRAVSAAVDAPRRGASATALHTIREDLTHNQRRSLAEIGRELLGLLIRYAVGHQAIRQQTVRQQAVRRGPARSGEAVSTGPLLRRGRQLGRSYGMAARRLGLRPSAVVATFNFFQEAVVATLAECDALDYPRLNRLFSVVLLAAVTAAEPSAPGVSAGGNAAGNDDVAAP